MGAPAASFGTTDMIMKTRFYVVFFRKRGQNGYPKWLHEDPTADKGEAKEQLSQAKAIGCEAQLVTVEVPVPEPGLTRDPFREGSD